MAERRRHAATAAVLAMAVAACPVTAVADGDPAAGETLFRPCMACHQIGEGAINRIGPHLNGLVGRPIGSVDGFRYSDTLSEAGSDGDLWTEAALSNFLEDPRGYMPGTSMVFRGIRDAEDRADLIAYLLRAGGPADTAASASAVADPSPEVAAILEIEGDIGYGEFLSSECTACHRGSGGDEIPSIAGLAPSVFVASLVAYRTGEREHQVMNMVTARLGDEEIAALAAYFRDRNE